MMCEFGLNFNILFQNWMAEIINLIYFINQNKKVESLFFALEIQTDYDKFGKSSFRQELILFYFLDMGLN